MTRFSNPEEWRLHLYQQNSKKVAETYANVKESDEVGIFLIDLRDSVGQVLAKSLIRDLDTNQNTIFITVGIEKYFNLLRVLANQKKNGFQNGQLMYDRNIETPVCVIAANGSTFITITKKACKASKIGGGI